MARSSNPGDSHRGSGAIEEGLEIAVAGRSCVPLLRISYDGLILGGDIKEDAELEQIILVGREPDSSSANLTPLLRGSGEPCLLDTLPNLGDPHRESGGADEEGESSDEMFESSDEVLASSIASRSSSENQTILPFFCGALSGSTVEPDPVSCVRVTVTASSVSALAILAMSIRGTSRVGS